MFKPALILSLLLVSHETLWTARADTPDVANVSKAATPTYATIDQAIAKGDPTVKSKTGVTALDIAKEYKNQPAIDVLSKL